MNKNLLAITCLTLSGIPQALNGCRVYCKFSNSAGSVKTASALITVKSTPVYTDTTMSRYRLLGTNSIFSLPKVIKHQIRI